MVRFKNTFTKTNIIIIMLALAFVFELLNTIVLYYSDLDKSRLSGCYKVLLQLMLLLTISFCKIPRKQIILSLLILLFALINQFVLNPIFTSTWQKQILQGSIYFVDRFLFVFLLVFACNSWKEKDKIIKKVLIIIEVILITNSVLIVLGAIFDIDLLKTYSNSLRFGWDGLFNRQNQVSTLYILFISYLYYKLILKQVKFIYFFFIVISSLLIGTKVILLFLLLLFIFHFSFQSLKKNLYRKGFLLLAVFFCFFYKSIFKTYFSMFSFWKDLDSKYSLVSKIFSTRDLVLIQNYEYVKTNWNFVNYIIGGGWYTKEYRIIEMDFFAPIIIFGFLGAIIYLYLFVLNFFESRNKLKNGILLIILFCGFLSGSFFASVNAMIFLYFMSHYMKNKPI